MVRPRTCRRRVVLPVRQLSMSLTLRISFAWSVKPTLAGLSLKGLWLTQKQLRLILVRLVSQSNIRPDL